jgi:hypothetical protein
MSIGSVSPWGAAMAMTSRQAANQDMLWMGATGGPGRRSSTMPMELAFNQNGTDVIAME